MKMFNRIVTGLVVAATLAAAPAIASKPQYLVFQIFSGGPDPRNGVFVNSATKSDYLAAANRIAAAIGPSNPGTGHYVGFAVGPIAMDQGEAEVRSVIRDAFAVALESNLAVALHLDDYMFWGSVLGPNGKPLRENPNNIEWKDWQGTPADGLKIGWLEPVNLPPQMCFESPEISALVTSWSRDVIGKEVRSQLDMLARQGKSHLFAGIISGWESNLAYGFCSLTQLGFSASNPPQDFDFQRERVLQRHIARVAKGLHDAGIARDLIFTHIAPIPKSDYDQLRATMSQQRIRDIHQSTVFRAFWTAFNEYSNPGFGAYAADGRFIDIYQALDKNGNPPWAMAEGTNVVLSAGTHTGGAVRSPIDWETYLGLCFNHGARIVNIFGGFMGVDAGLYQQATESQEAIAAYQKFLRGETLIEDPAALSAAASSTASSGNPTAGHGDLQQRLQQLPRRLEAFAQAGGDTSVLMPKLQSLDGYMKSGDIEKVMELLGEIESHVE